MKKKILKLTSATFALLIAGTSASQVQVYAAENSQAPYVSYSIEFDDDEALKDAVLLSSESHINDGRLITTNIYKQQDGTIITDELSVNAAAAYSTNGSDRAVRTRKIGEYATVTITAYFSWYTQNFFSYVRCDSMSANYTLNGSKLVSWDTDYTKDYVSIGKAHAQVKYHFKSTSANTYAQGTFKITCTDKGTISQN